MIYLHVGRFADGISVVGFRFCHATFDGVGAGLVFREWESAMRDPQAYALLPPISVGPRDTIFDPLGSLRSSQEEKAAMSKKRVKEEVPPGYAAVSLWWVVRFVWGLVFQRVFGGYKERIVRVPKPYVFTPFAAIRMPGTAPLR